MSDRIPVKNIYYMLAYAFQFLNQDQYRGLELESFDNNADLCAALLVKGIEQQLKRFLNREYVTEKDSLSALRGKVEITDSINQMTFLSKKYICSFDEFSIDSKMNRILKSTCTLLIHSEIEKQTKAKLKSLMIYFAPVREIDLHNIDWIFHFNRNNQSYRILMGICYLVVKGLLQTQTDGTYKLMNYFDEQRMCRLYEKFILEYYRTEHEKDLIANSNEIDWILDNDFDDMLPKMQSDIMLYDKKNRNNILIIDAKYYSHSTQVQFEKHTVHSANLYQIFTYVKNKEYELDNESHKVSGMLLYARTSDNQLNEHNYQMSGNSITVRTLVLDCEFSEIRAQLDGIAESFLGNRE